MSLLAINFMLIASGNINFTLACLITFLQILATENQNSSENDVILANYRVNYLYGEKQRPVDYSIDTHFRLQNGKIVDQKDIFGSISQFEFAEMAFGFPMQLLALTPLLRVVVRKKAAEKLSQFMNDYKYWSLD